MKFKKKRNTEILEGDLTPMIDMTFQLIAFFMLLINFSEVDRAEEIVLPKSVLATPPTERPDYQVILNLDPDGSARQKRCRQGHCRDYSCSRRHADWGCAGVDREMSV